MTNDEVPMTVEDLRNWFVIRGVEESQLDDCVDTCYGKTLSEMDAMYESMHGSMA